LKTTIRGKVVPDYAKVQGILIGVVAAFVIFITIIGPECVFPPPPLFRGDHADWPPAHRNHGSHFEKHRAAFDEGGGSDDAWIDDDGVHHETGRAAHDRDVEAAENEKASEERSSTEKPAVTPTTAA
jgi:SHS family lactate transporter-like MFS transporter